MSDQTVEKKLSPNTEYENKEAEMWDKGPEEGQRGRQDWNLNGQGTWSGGDSY